MGFISPGWEMLNQLGPLLLEIINTAVHKVSFGRDVNTAQMLHLLKKGKDAIQSSHYLPLSFTNTDIACETVFQNVVIPSRDIPKLVHTDQRGCVKKKHFSSFNICRLLYILIA